MDIVPGLKGFGTDTRAAYGAANPPEICVVNSLATTTGPPTAYGNEAEFKVTGEDPPNDSPIWVTGLSYLSNTLVKASIIANAGAYTGFRDSLDLRFIDEMTNGTGSTGTVKGSPASRDWPVLAENVSTLSIPANPHTNSEDGYTNLEKWLHVKAADVENYSYGDPYTRRRGILHGNPSFNMVGWRYR